MGCWGAIRWLGAEGRQIHDWSSRGYRIHGPDDDDCSAAEWADADDHAAREEDPLGKGVGMRARPIQAQVHQETPSRACH